MKKTPTAAACTIVAATLLWAALIPPTWAAGPPPVTAAGTSAATAGDENVKTEKETVRLIVDYGDGVQKHFHQIKWQDKMTVQDVTLAASKHPRGIQIKQRGKKATAFLSQIDDLANNPRGRSWVYRVNGKLADRSFGVSTVKAGDVVSWSYQDYP